MTRVETLQTTAESMPIHRPSSMPAIKTTIKYPQAARAPRPPAIQDNMLISSHKLSTSRNAAERTWPRRVSSSRNMPTATEASSSDQQAGAVSLVTKICTILQECHG